ncbi:MAG: T9SS type A sorting domain-containing protein [Bacteroidota bacterium]
MLKRLLLFGIAVLWTSLSSFAQTIAPQEQATLFDHMKEVNKEWTNFYPTVPTWLQKTVSFQHEEERIQEHLELVIQHLSMTTDDWALTQAKNRSQLLNTLAGYAVAQQFPKNIYHGARQPYFIDHEHTHCAVGYLIQQSGHGDFARFIADKMNYAYVEEMQFPELLAWAGEHGFEKAELAWIQPGYPPEPLSYDIPGNGIGPDGAIEVLYHDEANNQLIAAGTFNEFDGQTTGNLVSWDGSQWQALGPGIAGEIYDVEVVNGTLFVAGAFDFFTPFGYAKVAYLENGQWEYISGGEKNLKCLEFEQYDGLLYVGCDIGPPMNSIQDGLIAINPNTKLLEDSPIVVGKVYGLAASPEGLGIAGDINYIIEEGGTFVDLQHFAIWDGSQISYMKTTNDGVLTALHYRYGHFLTANTEGLLWFDGTSWSNSGGEIFANSEGHVKAFENMGDQIVATGEFTFYPFVGNFGQGLIEIDFIVDQNYFAANGLAYLDNSVNSVAPYNDQLFIGGTFTKAYGVWSGDSTDLPSIAAFDADLSTPIIRVPGAEIEVNVFAFETALVVDFKQNPQPYQIELFDAVGRQVFFDQEPTEIDRMQYSMEHLNTGAYFYRMQIGDQSISGKLLFSR